MVYIVHKDILKEFEIAVKSNLTFVPVDLNDIQVAAIREKGYEITIPKAITPVTLDGNYPHKQIGAVKYDKKNIKGRGVKIAVFDNGFNPGLISNGIYINPTGQDIFAVHGTQTAQIVQMYAPLAELHCYKFSTGFTEAEFLNAIDYFIEEGIHILNMSFAQGETPAQIAALADLRAAGCLAFAASGNAQTPSNILFPANDDNVYAVNSISEFEGVAHQNYLIPPGKKHGIHISVGGWNVLTSDGEGGSFLNFGTSYSAPCVVGIAACIAEEIGIEKLSRVPQILFNQAKPSAYPNIHGAGILQA